MNTVFILGAGASLDFDRSNQMPVGTDLARMIRAALSGEISAGTSNVSDDSVQHVLGATGGFTGVHKEAMHTIRDHIHTKDSIDDLVNEWAQDRPEVAKVAKICIARQILHAERKSLMGPAAIETVGPGEILNQLSNSWLGQVHRRHRIGENVRRRDLDDVFHGLSFVTFNYDRTIEQYLALAYIALGGFTADEAYAHIKRIPIHHVYGSLGELGREGGLPYGGSSQELLRAWQGIKTYNEEVGTEHASTIAEVVRRADKLVFLGLGYHPQNMRILFPYGKDHGAQAFCCTLGLSPRRHGELGRLFSGTPKYFAERCDSMIATASDDLFY